MWHARACLCTCASDIYALRLSFYTVYRYNDWDVRSGWNVRMRARIVCVRDWLVVVCDGCMMVVWWLEDCARPKAVVTPEGGTPEGGGLSGGFFSLCQRHEHGDGLVVPLLLVSVRDVGALVETRVVGLPRIAWVSGAAGSGAPHWSTGATW